MVVVDFHQQGQWHGQVDNVELAQAAQTHQQIHHIMQHITNQLHFPPLFDHHKGAPPPKSNPSQVQHEVHKAKR